MKIVILAGGTGSIALQTGLYGLLDSKIEGVDTKVIVNAYDNGLSTGAVRKVLNGEILGPSDVRKNQTTRFKLENPSSPLLNFLDVRFTSAPDKAQRYCLNRLFDLGIELLAGRNSTDRAFIEDNIKILEQAINTYFKQSIASKIDYNDFSLANIIYAGLATQNGNSLRKAATIMSAIMGIKDNVILNDDTSLFLGAVTKSGYKIVDEGDIVSWNNPDDPIQSLTFTDAHGNSSSPVLCDEAKKVISEADLIILSSGTQWSSLIPTYESIGFKEAISASSARVFMVMNRVPDKDAPEQSASDIINILVPRYFDKGRLEVIIDSTGDALMASVDSKTATKTKSINLFNLEVPFSEAKTKHSHHKLAEAIAKTYFKDFLDASAYVFDYDDTLVGRGNSYPKASRFNTNSLIQSNKKKFVCTGNSIKAIQLHSDDSVSDLQPLTVFADGGINEYQYDPCRTVHDEEEFRRFSFVSCLDDKARFDVNGPNSIDTIISNLRSSGIPAAKIENRGDVMVSIKPIDPEYRQIVRSLVEIICRGSGFEVRAAGRTTVEIFKSACSKEVAVKKVANSNHGYTVYVGDELESGNDVAIAELAKTNKKVRCLKVRSPADTAFFLMALNPKKVTW